MTFNPLNVFLQPRETVKAFYEQPNLLLALGLVVLPFLYNIGVLAVAGAGWDVISLVLELVRKVVYWIAGGIILYVLLYALKGKAVKGHLNAVLSAVSLAGLVVTALLVVISAGIVLLLPGLLPLVQDVNTGALSGSQVNEAVTALNVGDGPVAFLGGVLVFLAALALIVLLIYVHYLVISQAPGGGVFRNLVVLVLFLALSAMLPALF